MTSRRKPTGSGTKNLLDWPPLDALRALAPVPFREEVGVMFDRLGYAVITSAAESDLVMTKDGRKYLVACTPPLRVEPTPPREMMRLHAAITAASAQAGYYVTTRTFTPDAQAYAVTAPLHLVDGEQLAALMQRARPVLSCRRRMTHCAVNAVHGCGTVLTAPTLSRVRGGILWRRRLPAPPLGSSPPLPRASWAVRPCVCKTDGTGHSGGAAGFPPAAAPSRMLLPRGGAPTGPFSAVGSPVSSRHTGVTAMRHIAIESNPREAGLTPYCVQFTREESPPVRSLVDEGFWYTHPAHEATAIVWAKDGPTGGNMR